MTFIDCVPCLRYLYGTRNKSAPADLAVASTILIVVEGFVADRGVSLAFQIDNGSEYTNLMFVNFFDGLGIRRESTAPWNLQKNDYVERALANKIKAGLAARI